MTDRIKAAFESIRAEDTLKSNTMLYLQKEREKRRKAPFYSHAKKYAIVLSCIAVLLTGTLSYNLYFSEAAYVDVDVNPSIELAINRFDRVIGVYAYNSNGEAILSEVDIKHKSYGDALIDLLTAIGQKGYFQNDGLVSITLQSDNTEDELLAALQANAATISGHHGISQIDVFAVSGEIRTEARNLDISPAKYLAIMELIEVDPTVTVEGCRGHSISEIKKQTQAHGGDQCGEDGDEEYRDNDHHHGGGCD